MEFQGVWGKMREDFLRENKPDFYKSLKDSGKLATHLKNYQEKYSLLAEGLVKNFEEKFGVDEKFFRRDSLEYILLSTKIFLKVNSKLKAEIQK